MGNIGYNVNAQCPSERAAYDQCQSELMNRLTSGGYNYQTDTKCKSEFEALKKCTYDYIAMRQRQYIERKTGKTLHSSIESDSRNNNEHTTTHNNTNEYNNIQSFDLDPDNKYSNDGSQSTDCTNK